jgi:hypothetical protein
MPFVRVTISKLIPGSAEVTDELLRLAHEEITPLLQDRPGFISYQLVKFGPEAVGAISTWKAREEAEESAVIAANWLRDNLPRDQVVSFDTLIGEIVHSNVSRGAALA